MSSHNPPQCLLQHIFILSQIAVNDPYGRSRNNQQHAGPPAEPLLASVPLQRSANTHISTLTLAPLVSAVWQLWIHDSESKQRGKCWHGAVGLVPHGDLVSAESEAAVTHRCLIWFRQKKSTSAEMILKIQNEETFELLMKRNANRYILLEVLRFS